MMRHIVRSVALVGLCFLVSAGVALAQQTGGISGVITDPAGAAIPGAQVKAINTGTNAVRTVDTSSSGTYSLSPLSVGQYTVEVTKPGFKMLRQANVVIDINSALTLNLALPVGEVDQQVNVSTTPPLIDTENQELGNYRIAAQLENLPILVREVQTLVGQTPGVPYGTGGKVASDTDTVGGTFNPGGSSRSGMIVMSDGTQLNSFQTTGYPAIDGIQRRADLPVPNIDTISQFKLVTNGASAEFMSPVAMIIATKSGTNKLHGSAYEFYQSGGLSAEKWSLPVPQSYVRQQYGGSATGPIFKNKLFFAAAAEEFSYVQNEDLNERYPTASELAGNFAELETLKTPDYLFDPVTGAQFANNYINPMRFDAVAVAELKQLIPVGAPVPSNNITAFNALISKPEYDKSQKYDGRIDWNINPSNLVFFRTTIGHINQASVYKGAAPGNYGFEVKNYYTHVFTAAWTHILSPTSVFKLTFSRRDEPFKNEPTDGNTPFSVAIQNLTPTPPFAGPPAITIGSNGAGISDLTDRDYLGFSNDNDYQVSPYVQKTLNRHTFTMGAFFLRGVKTEQLAGAPWGQYTTASKYNTTPTTYASSTSSATGDAFADFLLGLPATTTVIVGQTGGYLAKYTWSLFFQDDWKATTNLTLNFGLRYDYLGHFFVTDNRGSNSDFATGQIVIPDGSLASINPAFQPYASSFITTSAAGVSRSFTHSYNLNLDPRLGFAYRFAPSTVLRGGFGVYNNDFNYSAFSNEINQPPFTYDAKLTRALLIPTLTLPVVNAQYTFENPTINGSPAAAASVLQGFAGFNPDYKTQRALEFNLTLEKQLGLYSFAASYVGNLGRHIDQQVEVNACPPGPTLCTSLTSGQTGARKWTQYGLTFGENSGADSSNYHAFHAEVQRHLSHGILLDVNYGFQKLLALQYTATNPVSAPSWQYDYGPVSQQPYQVLHFNHVIDLPFGRGRQFGSHMNPYADALVGGWKLSGVGTWQSGQQLTPLAGSTFPSPTDATSNRANQICGAHLAHKTFGGPQFNTACFTAPTTYSGGVANSNSTYNFGSEGIGTVIGPRWFSYDANIQKSYRIRSRATFEVRVDAINVFNHPIEVNPDVTLTDGTLFGLSRSQNTNYLPREFQFGGRLDF